jgi:hypothetical protein
MTRAVTGKPKGRPRGKPFRKGASPNPGGKPKGGVSRGEVSRRKIEKDARLLAREHGVEAVEKLITMMRGVITVEVNEKQVEVVVPPMAQLTAASAILDRGYGRPPQALELMGNDGGTIQTEESDALEIIESRLAVIRERLREEGHPLLIE